MKKLIAVLALACLATPALAMETKRTNTPTGPTREQIAAEAAREAVVPVAELQSLKDRWADVSKARSDSSTEKQTATYNLSLSTQRHVQAADTARTQRNRATFDSSKKAANEGMNEMCTTLGC